jgi:tRNA 2-thiouridine synthesizing protein A
LLPSVSAVTESAEHLVTRLIGALATVDRSALEQLPHPDAQLRAVLPRRYVERSGRDAVATEMTGWFDEVPRIDPVRTQVSLVGDVWYAGLRFDLHGLPEEYVVEQHAYCTVVDGAITAIRLVCSGFRPAAPAPAPAPLPFGCIDALGEGCATLTPRIAAAVRRLAPGEVLTVLTDDPSAADDLAAWCRLTGHQLVAATTETDGTRYHLRHR